MKRCLNGRPLLLTGGTGPWSWQLVLCTFLLALSAPVGWAQQMGPTRVLPPPLRVALDSVAVAPQALDTQGWLLLNPDIQTELDGAVHNLYNFKFNQAERQFRSLRRRYPQHPMPYFLLGLSTWWKIMPSNAANRQYDRVFFAYLDTAIVKAQRLYDTDNQNYEASFFLSAAYGFDARLHAERRDWRKATVSSKRALTYLQKSLAQDFPDNACFARSYATQAFAEGEFDECEKMSRTILAKLNQGLAGYEASSGRVAAYYLGYLLQNRYRDPVQAADYYRRCLVFSETEQLTMGYYVFANAALARLAARQPDVITACRYYAVVVAKAGRHEPQYAEARAYLRQHRASNGRL
jgi:hypothetical protein